MLTVAIGLYLVAAIGLLAMAAKFGVGAFPAPHHAQALQRDGIRLTPNLTLVLRGIYRTMAGGFAGLAVLIAYLAIGPLRQGVHGAEYFGLLAGLVAGVPATLASRRLEVATGVSSPWKIAAALTIVVVVGSVAAGMAR